MRYILFLSILFSYFLFFSKSSFSMGNITILVEEADSPQFFDLQGREGFNGKDAQESYALDCSSGVSRQGRRGLTGGDGGDGEDGGHAFIYYESLKSLKSLTLNQEGGGGGEPGAGALGGPGCHGGNRGAGGLSGRPGENGKYGKLFLLEDSHSFTHERPRRVISLKEFEQEEVSLTKHEWNRFYGARELFSSSSNIHNDYYIFKETREHTVKLVWLAQTPLSYYFDTKIALSIDKGKLEITSYRGGIIDYRVSRNGETWFIEILGISDESEIKNLDFGKMRESAEELTLEVRERFKPIVRIETKFVISIYQRDETLGRDIFLGQFGFAPSEVLYKERVFSLPIGRLNFPFKFKKHGVKLKINLSVYRRARGQTRVLGIKGIFRI